MDEIKTLAKAMRCTVNSSSCDDETCPYRLEEEIRSDFPVSPDLERDGVGYWVSCDVDRMAMDAADALERMLNMLEGR